MRHRVTVLFLAVMFTLLFLESSTHAAGTQFKTAGAFTSPANGFSRSITFVAIDATYMVELWRGSADVPN